jgi:hypothetical protein
MMELSKETLEVCDFLIDGVTIALNHPEFTDQAARWGKAKDEVTAALVEAGGVPLKDQRPE